MSYSYKQLQPPDLVLYKDLMKLFGDVFEDKKSYQNSLPSDEYIEKFLKEDKHIMLVALENGSVVGGLVAYVLDKFEQQRSEIYVYDLAISNSHQRKGIGTALFEQLKLIAKQKQASVIFVQADEEDEGAISFYQSLSSSEIKAHQFDIET